MKDTAKNSGRRRKFELRAEQARNITFSTTRELREHRGTGTRCSVVTQCLLNVQFASSRIREPTTVAAASFSSALYDPRASLFLTGSHVDLVVSSADMRINIARQKREYFRILYSPVFNQAQKEDILEFHVFLAMRERILFYDRYISLDEISFRYQTLTYARVLV